MVNPHTITRKQLQIYGSWGFEPRHVDKALALLENPHWQQRFASEITHRHPLAQASAAVENARQARGGKTVLVL
jgi:threonine dehydrogenase-like Zn-dependent dehydrogenase